MFAPSSIQQVPPGEGEMNKENASATTDAAVIDPVVAAPTPETDITMKPPVPSTPVPVLEEPSVPAGAMDSGIQPSAGYSTFFFNYDEPEELDDDDLPIPGRKRKRNSTNIDYLTDMANKAEPAKPSEKKPAGTPKGKQGPTWKGHEVKHGVPIGVWSMSDEPLAERKHLLHGFLDPKGALHGRKYPERKDGSKYTGNFPSGTGTWAAKADEWLLDPHLKGLTRKELTEYVRIRVATWKSGEAPEDRDALDKSAVAEAKAIAAASETTVKSENKGNSARKAKKGTPRKYNKAKLHDDSTPRGSSEELYSPRKSSTKKASRQDYTPSGKREARVPAASDDTPLGKKASSDPQMTPPLPKSTPNGKPAKESPGKVEKVPRERSKYVVKGKDVLLGYWKDSSEPLIFNKHAMYGVIQAHGVFRVKVVPETRDGRYIEGGNYPKLCGGCWVNYDTCVFETYLKDLIRTEIEEYCRICVADPEYSGGTQGRAIARAVEAAKRIVAEKAAAKGMDIIEYNRKRCDQLENGAIARVMEKQRRNGEPVLTPVKAEVKPTAKRSDKAASDAIAQKVRLERKAAKEARERETMNSKGDADLAEAIRRSTSEKEKETPVAQKKPGHKSDVTPATASAYNHLKHGSDTAMSDAGSANGAESDTVKFYLLDRDTQRVKMERWCQLKKTSQYHNLDREGQRRHVEKHIDQLIEKQTGAAPSRRPKKRSRTSDHNLANPAHPGAVSAPSPLADMTRAASIPAPTTSTSQEPTSAAADVASAHRFSRTESPAVRHQLPSEPSAGVRANLTLRSVLNEPITPIQSESEATPQPKAAGQSADVSMVDAPVEPTPPAESSAAPLASVETAQYEPRAATTQSKPMGNYQQPSVSDHVQSRQSTAEGAPKPSHPSASPSIPMSDAPPFSAEASSAAESTIAGAAPTAAPDQTTRPQFPPHLQQHVFNTPQNGRGNLSDHSPGFMSAPPRPYVTPYPTPPSVAAATPARAQSSPAPVAPQILVGLDGVKYSSDPTSEFGELLVSANRELVEIEDVEYTRQVVLVGKKAPRPPKAAGPETKMGEETFRMAMGGVFEGYLVGVERKVTRLAGEDYIKFDVLVPF